MSSNGMQMTSSSDDKQAEGQRDESVPVPLTSLSVTALELSKVHGEQGNQRIDRNMQKTGKCSPELRAIHVTKMTKTEVQMC